MMRIVPEGSWVYENWRAHGHRVTIHRASCAHCNNGHGLHGGTRADNGRWLGPYASREKAEVAAREIASIQARARGICGA